MPTDRNGPPPKREDPQRRYASLHRALDQGNGNDAIWSELTRVCVQIGYIDEAIRAVGEIQDPQKHTMAETYLVMQGLLERPARVHPGDTPSGTRAVVLHATFREEVGGAFQFLFDDHMPLTVMVATLTCPLVLGLGGFLTSGSNAIVFPAIALIPILTVLCLVGALSRRILVEAARGIEDPPRIPEIGSLTTAALRFLSDTIVLSCIFLSPGIACWIAGLETGITVSTLALGGMLLPMAMALRQVRNDWKSITPRILFPTVARAGLPYVGTALFCAAVFAPAVAAGLGSAGSDLYLQASFVGPLCIAPLFASSRLLGRVLHGRKAYLGELIRDQSGKEDVMAAESTIVSYEEARAQASSTTKMRREQPQERPAAAPRRQSKRGDLGAATHPEAAQPPKRKAKVKAKAKAKAIPDVIGEAPPDLTQMPGFRVIRSSERVRAGAAAGHQQEQER